MEERQTNTKIIVKIRNPFNFEIDPDFKQTPEIAKNPVLPKRNTSKSPTTKSTINSKSKSPISRGNKNQDLTQLSTTNNSKDMSITQLSDKGKYTIFTSINPSNVVVATEKPILGKLIKDTFHTHNEIYDHSINLLKNTSLLEFDSVYNEQYKIDKLYNENIKEKVSEMIKGKNCCVLFFGPSDGGKSYSLRGGDPTEKGILDRATDDLFNLLEISNQINQGSSFKTVNYAIKISIYQVFNDNINDLLSKTQSAENNLKVEKIYDNETNDTYTKIIDLNERELRSKKDVSLILNEALKIRKNYANLMKVNELKKKSHLVISLVLNKIIKSNDSYNKTNEKVVEKYSQIDFVEMASSQFGLPKFKLERPELYQTSDDVINKNISSTFNSICNNIVSASIGQPAKNESKLSLCLKPTLNRNSSIVFITCVHSTEYPLNISLKSLKFVNWMRNQIFNNKENIENEGVITENIYPSTDKRYIDTNQNVPYYERPRVDDTDSYSYNYNRTESKNFDNSYEPTSPNRGNEINDLKHYNQRGMKNVFKNNQYDDDYNIEPSNSMIYSNNYENSVKTLPRSNERTYELENKYIKTNPNYINHSSELSKNSINNNATNKIQEIEQQILNLTSKSNDISKNLEILKQEKMSRSIDDNRIVINDPNSEKLKQENSILRADNIIFKEEIARLSDITIHYEEELIKQRNKSLELAAENERILQEKLLKQQEIEKLLIENARLKGREIEFQDQNNVRYSIENKLREYESELRQTNSDKQKFEVDFKVLSERFNDIKSKYDQSEAELSYLKIKQSEEMNLIESKLEKMSKDLEYMQRENNSLRSNEERLRQELLNVEKQRDNFREKYMDCKGKNNVINTRVVEIENEMKNIMDDKQNEQFILKKNEEEKKSKIETKQKLIDDLHNNLINFKAQFLRQRMKKNDF